MSFNASMLSFSKNNSYLTVMISRYSFSSLYNTNTFSLKQEFINLDKNHSNPVSVGSMQLWSFTKMIMATEIPGIFLRTSIRCDSLSQGRNPHGCRIPHNARR